jgi:hydrogenase maturation protease
VLALGNDVAGDDAVGLHAARSLRCLYPAELTIVESGEAGLALLDIVEGYDRLLILDTVYAEDGSEGNVVTLTMADLRPVSSPSPHYAGLPELARIAEQCGMAFPTDIQIVAAAIRPPEVIREGLSPAAGKALTRVVAVAEDVLRGWGYGRA